MNLYQIDEKYIGLKIALEASDGELTEELEQLLNEDAQDITQKYNSYLHIINSFEADSDHLEKEIKRLQGIKKSRDKGIERLKENLKASMELREEEKFQGENFTISFRKSESVEIIDEFLLSKDYLRVSYTPDKTLIKEKLKAGEEIPGAVIKINKNIQIK